MVNAWAQIREWFRNKKHLFHILVGFMTVEINLARYLMCLRSLFPHLAINELTWFVWFRDCFSLGKENFGRARHQAFTIQILLEQLISFSFFCKFKYIDCFSYIVFFLVSLLSKDSHVIWTHLAIQSIPRYSSQRSNVFVLYRNTVLQWMVT